MVVLSKRDVEIVAACVIAFAAFRPDAGLTEAADISHLGEADLDRGAYLLDTLTEAEVASALVDAESLCAMAERAS